MDGLQKMVILLLVAILISQSAGFPSTPIEQGEGPDQCKMGNEDAIENCQRCAKQTKSPVVYPMCCKNIEDVYQWCSRFVNFGIQQ